MRTRQLFWLFLNLLALICYGQPAIAGSLRVTPAWLKSHLNDTHLVILDCRPNRDYEIDHIPGAVSFPESLTYQDMSKGGQITQTNVMQGLLRQRGLDINKKIVIYDAGRLIQSARVFWALEVYGFTDVKVLTKGYDYWLDQKYPTSTVETKVKPSNYVASINYKRIASKFTTRLATINPKQIVIDARRPDAYNGKTSSAKRFGHIPTAINIPAFKDIKVENGIRSLRSIEELRKLYSKLPTGDKIITYCGNGKASSTVYFALRELGYDVANYDAAWHEWGDDLSLPIEK